MPIFETREQLLTRMNEALGDRTDDVALNFIQDTLATYDKHSSSDGSITQEEHKRLMEEQDNKWRKRYRDTFFGTPDPNLKPDGMSDKSKSDPAKGIPGGSENNPSDFGDLFSAK